MPSVTGTGAGSPPALPLMGVAVVLGGLRWWLLLEGAADTGVRFARREGIRSFCIPNILLPTAVAGDAVRIWVVGKRAVACSARRRPRLLTRLTARRAFSDSLGLPTYSTGVRSLDSLVVVFTWVTAGLLVAFAVAGLAGPASGRFLHRFPERLAAMARESWRMIRIWAGSGRLIVSLVGLGVAYQVLAVIVFILVGKTLGAGAFLCARCNFRPRSSSSPR